MKGFRYSWHLFIVAFISLLFSQPLQPVIASQPPSSPDNHWNTPFQVRDYTFPSFLLLGFSPTPAKPLEHGHHHFNFSYSVVNDFQVSATVEQYLKERHGDKRRPLDTTDINFIRNLPQGEGYYIDGEFTMLELNYNLGLGDQLELGVTASYIFYGGRLLDGVIYDFHDAIGTGQQGREYVADNQVQVVLARDNGKDIVLPQRPSRGGFTDPAIYIRTAFPIPYFEWQGKLSLGIKPPLMSEHKFLSSGSWDSGFQLTLDKQASHNIYTINTGYIYTGGFEQTHFNPPSLPYINLGWLHRYKKWPNTRSQIQIHLAEHPYRDLVDSALSELQFQITLGIKWKLEAGMLGMALSENVLNFDNTPDVVLHLSWERINCHYEE